MTRVNWPVFWVGNIFGLLETAHFGWNLTAQSDAEMICDGIAMLILALSFAIPPAHAVTYECCNDACPWRDIESETVHPKHDPSHLLCPECHEVVEKAD